MAGAWFDRMRSSPRAAERPPEPAPDRDPRLAQLMLLQRGAGNQAVSRMLTAGGNQLQRLIATNEPKVLYAPTTVDLEGQQGRIRSTLVSLLGDHTVNKQTLQQFRRSVAFPDATWPEDPAGEAEDLDVEADTAVRGQFADTMKVFNYSRRDSIQWGVPDLPEALLLAPAHMGERSDPLPGQAQGRSACVVQALESIGQFVPGGNAGTTAAWHTYCRTRVPQIDYRTDNQIARLYVEVLGFQLVNNTVKRWQDIDWTELGGDGTYLASTYPFGAPTGNPVGHMIAVIVRGGRPDTIHDQQRETKPSLEKQNHNVHVRYVYKVS